MSRIGNAIENAIKYDAEKPPLSLLPTDPLVEIAKVLEFGARKYEPHNWRKGFTQSRLISALLRHILAYNNGQDLDEETRLSHIAHAGCMLLFLLEQQLHPEQYKQFDDRYISLDRMMGRLAKPQTPGTIPKNSGNMVGSAQD